MPTGRHFWRRRLIRGGDARRGLAAPAWATALPLCACATDSGVLAPASGDARMIADLGWWMFGVAGFVMIVTLGMLFVGLNLRRAGAPRPISFRTSAVIVVSGGVIAPILAIVALTVSGVAVGVASESPPETPGPVIEVAGERWWWRLTYLDEAGETIAVTANELHLPVGERATLRLVSDNVIHSFWAPAVQGKTDLIPGKTNLLFAEPEEAGVWRGQCAEFCGMQHALMGLLVVSQEPGDYVAWLDRQAAEAEIGEHPGREVFVTEGCAGCHAIRGTDAFGQRGPDLTHLASRRTIAAGTLENTRANLGRWIRSNQDVKPGAQMPQYDLEAQRMADLLDYLERLE